MHAFRKVTAGPRAAVGPAPLIIVVAFGLAVSGCASAVGVSRLSARDVHRSVTSNALSTGDLSEETQITLRNHNLVEQFDKTPEEALAKLRADVLSAGPSNADLFALTELSFFHAEHSHKRSYYLAAAVYAFAYLFPEDAQRQPVAMDPRYRWACDIYERAVTEGFREIKGDNMDPRAGLYELPFGTLDVSFDTADLVWGTRRLKDFVPVGELDVRGLRNRYRSHGIGAPLAAATEIPAGTDITQDLVGPYVRIPMTAVLLLERPRQQLGASELHATLRLFTATAVESVAIGEQSVPLEIDRTAPIATTLAANRMLDNELANFLGRAVGVTRQGRLGARAPYRRGQIPVVFVHGTNSSPARWADMVNDLEADDWVRQRFQFWFFSYDSGAPIAYSSMLLRNALRAAVKQFDPEGTDECLKHMVVIGHSQGGLLTKMMVINSGDRFWRNASSRELDELDLSEKTRTLLRDAMFVEPLPFVDRVIFVATPHRGSYLAGPELLRRLMQRLVSMPSTLLQTSADMFSTDSVKPYLKMQTLPTAIDNMSPSHPFIRTIAEIPVAPGVHAHSIIAVDRDTDGDGVVKYASAHIDGVESEYVVNSPHSCQSNPETVDEVRRILRLQAAQVSCGPPAPPAAGAALP